MPVVAINNRAEAAAAAAAAYRAYVRSAFKEMPFAVALSTYGGGTQALSLLLFPTASDANIEVVVGQFVSLVQYMT